MDVRPKPRNNCVTSVCFLGRVPLRKDKKMASIQNILHRKHILAKPPQPRRIRRRTDTSQFSFRRERLHLNSVKPDRTGHCFLADATLIRRSSLGLAEKTCPGLCCRATVQFSAIEARVHVIACCYFCLWQEWTIICSFVFSWSSTLVIPDKWSK